MHSNHTHTKAPAHKQGYFVRLGLVVLVAIVAGGFAAAGCLTRPLCSVKQSKKADGTIELIEDCKPRTTNLFVDTIQNKSVDKIDLLFMIDNSSSMADKQQVLAEAVPILVGRLVNPVCVDELGARANVPTPADPLQECPAPFAREFKPITNIHIGVVSSSIGSHGATGPNGIPHLCESGALPSPDGNDHAELIGSRPRGVGTGYPGANDPFLNWNPGAGAGDLNQLNAQFQKMVIATGQAGCGLEAQFESMYRFLIDPNPPLNIVQQGSPPRAVPQGRDDNILAQRKAFLRADSLVAVIMLTDENDCSVRDSDQFYYAAVLDGFLPQPATVCGTNPNDPCCYSCGLPPPANCAPDPKCTTGPGGGPPSLSGVEDNGNLRCFDQKRRFGIDFLYPIKRYVNALTQPVICTTAVDLAPSQQCPALPTGPGQVPNPLFQDLSGAGLPGRDPSLIFLAAITGVPWQLIQDPSAPGLRFYTADELTANNLWGSLMGDPNASPPAAPGDPHMQESVDPRPGLPGPNTPPNTDPIHGHEWVVDPTQRNDLQYACIFPKPGQPGACTRENSCDCFERPPGTNNPLCSQDNATYDAVQYKAKAYPCLREVQLLHDFGKNSILASLCPKQLTDRNAQDYGYNPAVDTIIDRLKEALTVKCLPRKLEVAADGTVPCSIIEATTNPADAACAAARMRKPADPRLVDPARQRLLADKACDNDPATGGVPDCNAFKFCEILPAPADCLDEVPNPASIGWCYVEPGHVPPLGVPSLVAKCPPNQKQILRFIGTTEVPTPARGSTVLIACLGAPVGSMGTPAPTAAPPPPMTLPDGAPAP
jgi:hypothetical protein